MGLKEQIEAWPDALRVALVNAAEAEASLAQVEVDLSLAQTHVRRMAEVNDQTNEDFPRVTDTLQYQAVRQRISDIEEQTFLARDAVNRAKAAADVQIREEAEAAGKRLTETAVRARVQVHPDVIAAEEHWRELQGQVVAFRAEARELWSEPTAGLVRRDADMSVADDDEDPNGLLAEIQQRHVDAIRQLELARAEVAYQHAIGKALGMLAKLAAAEIATGQ